MPRLDAATQADVLRRIADVGQPELRHGAPVLRLLVLGGDTACFRVCQGY